MNRNEEKMKKKKIVMLAAAAAAGLLCTGCSEKKTEEIGKITEETGKITEVAAAEGSEEAEETDTSGSVPELLSEYQEKNEDVYAWLEITGTNISFPVLQSAEDEAFYLTHNEEREEDDGGCIYTEYYNRKDFGDPNTVIYGRNVDSRFARLHQFQDRDFFDGHRELKIYTADEVLTYEIFAAYHFDDRHLIKIYDFWDEAIFSDYLELVFSQREMDAYIDREIEVTADDRIITLSTGVDGAPEKRYLVQAKRITE